MSHQPIKIIGTTADHLTFRKNATDYNFNIYTIPFVLSEQPDKLWIDMFLQKLSRESHKLRMGMPLIKEQILFVKGVNLQEISRTGGYMDIVMSCIHKANKEYQEYNTKRDNIVQEINNYVQGLQMNAKREKG